MERERMKRSYTLLAWLMAGAVACGGGDDPDGPGPTLDDEAVGTPVQVTGVSLGHGADTDGTADSPAIPVFRPRDQVVTRVETRGSGGYATLVATWREVGGPVISESSRSVSPDGADTTEFHVTLPDGWPTGEYEIEIWLDGERAATRAFVVEPAD